VSETLLSGLLAALDTVVFERLPNRVFIQLTPSPGWFSEAFGSASAGSPITLAQAFPALDPFLSDAETAWLRRQSSASWSEPFAITTSEGEVLLRAAAITVGEHPVLTIERLSGLADPRPLLQTARTKELERERTTARLGALRGPADALHATVQQLIATELTGQQRELVEALRRSIEQMVAVADGRQRATERPPTRG
jgi:hypothetical protein